LYQFNVKPFGLCNAPATFERLMEIVLRGLNWKTCLVCLDDIMVMGKTLVEFLGHVLSVDGIQTDDKKIQAVREWPVPKDKHELRSFLGLATHYRRFVERFANIAAPVHQLTENKTPYCWNTQRYQAFRRLKASLCSSLILRKVHFRHGCQ